MTSLNCHISAENNLQFGVCPFWFWNDKLSAGELVRQLKMMKNSGVSGFFIHARNGNKVPYLSSNWMQYVKTVIEKAKELGLKAWLYDEDNWPSGYAGGAVSCLGEKYLQCSMRCDEIPLGKNVIAIPQNHKNIIRIFLVGKTGNKIVEQKDITREFLKTKRLKKSACNPGCSLLFFYKESWNQENTPQALKDIIKNGYVDLLNQKVVETFIESTYDKYYKEVGGHFGKTVPGIFTDEPNYRLTDCHNNILKIPWTEKFPQYFMKKNGYSILDKLPALFFLHKDCHKVKYDFWQTLSDRFVETYTERIFNWCESHNLKFTGHFFCEVSLPRQIQFAGSVMRHYEYMHIPGIDYLSKKVASKKSPEPTILIKQVTSVAHQLGKEWIMCELYGGGGWDYTLSEQKWIGDWQLALGINFFVPHAYYYTVAGKLKRDYPPSLFYQQPWYKYCKLLNDYISSRCSLLSQGKQNHQHPACPSP